MAWFKLSLLIKINNQLYLRQGVVNHRHCEGRGRAAVGDRQGEGPLCTLGQGGCHPTTSGAERGAAASFHGRSCGAGHRRPDAYGSGGGGARVQASTRIPTARSGEPPQASMGAVAVRVTAVLMHTVVAVAEHELRHRP
jgi:hypothetical protein